MHYYIIDRKIKSFSDPLDSNLYSYPELTTEQKDFYIANPNSVLAEVLNLQNYPAYSPSITDLRTAKKSELDYACQNEILELYPYHKQINITNKNGYTDDDLFDMNTFISNCRYKLNILNSMVDSSSTSTEIENISWDITLDELINLVIASANPSSLDVSKLRLVNELKVWDKGVADEGYFDSIENLTLATKEVDVDAFTKDLTGLSSLIREASYNNNVTVPQTWTFIDRDKNVVSNLTPNEYISLLNRYFVSVRDNKMAYSYYLFLILSATSLEDLEAINFGG
jgi:hypothetical protein